MVYRAWSYGVRVPGLVMFQPGHDQGSSHGHHRMIRTSSLQDDGYVPLAERAFELWSALEQESGQELLRMTGEVRLMQPAGDGSYRTTAEELQRRGFGEMLDEHGLRTLYPGFPLLDGMFAFYEADTGFLWSERGIIAHVEAVRRHDATIRTGEEVTGWQADGAGVSVTTKAGTYRADRLVITADPWTAELLAGVTYPFDVIRSVNGYFEPERPGYLNVEQGAPDFLYICRRRHLLRDPSVGVIGVKIGRQATEWGTPTNARTIRREIDDREIDMMRVALDRYLPGAAGRELRRITCMCTYTVDDDFIIDRHPASDNVIIACGFSGHGYKFAPTVGEILAELATDDTTRHEIGFMAASRFT